MNFKKKENKYVYRILAFDRAIQIFESKKLHFSHPNKWPDPYETIVEHEVMNLSYAQCWCLKGVSDAMWRIYSPTEIGVRIKVKKETLLSQVKAGAMAIGAKTRFGKVRYLPESKLKEKIKALARRPKAFSERNAITPLFYKRLAYSHEREYRVVLYGVRSGAAPTGEGVLIEVNPHNLIESVLIDPRAPDEIYKAFELYLRKKIGFTGSVRKSGLYQGIDKIEF